MANTSGSLPPPREPLVVDAAADLELLDRATSLVEVDQVLDFGPWWYAPLLATCVGGMSLFGPGLDDWAILAGVIGLMAGLILSIHDYRRRTVRLRRSVGSLLVLGAASIVIWFMVAGWGTAISSMGYDRFVPGPAALAWLLTTLALLVIRAGLHLVRNRRPSLR